MHYDANGEPVICFNLPSPAHYSDDDGEVATVVISDGSSEDANAVVPPPIVDIAVPLTTAKLNGPTAKDPTADDAEEDATADGAEEDEDAALLAMPIPRPAGPSEAGEDTTADGAEEDEDAALLAIPIPPPAGPLENWHFGYWLDKNLTFYDKDVIRGLGGRYISHEHQWWVPPNVNVALFSRWGPEPASSQDESLCVLNLREGLVDWRLPGKGVPPKTPHVRHSSAPPAVTETKPHPPANSRPSVAMAPDCPVPRLATLIKPAPTSVLTTPQRESVRSLTK